MYARVVLIAVVVSCGGGGAQRPREEAVSADAPIVVVPQLGQAARMSSLAMSVDGKYLVTAREATLEVWEIATGALLRSFRDSEHVAGVAFAPDGKHVLSSGMKGALRLWDVTRGVEVRTFAKPPREKDAGAIAISPDGRRALTGEVYGGQLILWDITTGRPIRTLAEELGVNVVAFSPDGRQALTGGNGLKNGDDALRLWDLETGAQIRAFAGGQQMVGAVAFAPDGKTALVAADKQMTLWNVATGALVRTFDGWRSDPQPYERLEVQPMAVAFSPDGKRVLSSARVENPRTGGIDSLGHALYLWDVATGALIRRFHGANSWAHWAAFLPDGKHAIEGNEIWNLESGERVRALPALHSPGLRSVTFSPDGRYVLTGGTALQLWDLRTGSFARTLGADTTGGVATFLPDGRHVLASAEQYNRGMRLIDVETGQVVHVFPKHDDGMVGIVVTGDGKRAVTSDQHEVKLWDLETRTVVRSLKNPNGWIGGVALSPDGKRAIMASQKRPALDVIDLDTFKVVAGYHLHDASMVASVAFLPDGHAVSASWDRTVKIFDIATGNVALTFTGHTHYVNAVAISPDGRRVLSAGYDNVLRVWDAKTGTTIATLEGHGAPVVGLAMSPDGKRAASVSSDGTMRVWNLDAMSSRASVTMVASGGEWLAYTSDGFFDASRRGGALVAAVSGMRAFRIDQLAARFNRPDEILRVLGLGDAHMIGHFRARHELRLEKLGLRADQLATSFASAPDARIVDAASGGNFVDLTIELASRGASLLRYSVFVNEIPVLGQLGKPVTGRSQRVRERVELAPGRNKIEVSVIDARGAESLRDVRILERAGRPAGDLYVLAFGVSRYRDTRLNLGFAHKDALDLAAVFARAKGTTFRDVHVKTYTDGQVTTDAIRGARQHFAGAKATDMAIVFIAGHGVHAADATAEYYYATHDVDPKRLRETAAPFSLVESLLSEIAPRRKLLLIDTCESGEREDSGGSALPVTGARDLRSRAVRALVRTAEPARPPRPFLLERDRFIYNDLARRTGAIVFSSSRGSELSYEHDDWANGAFTAELKLALTTTVADLDRDGAVSIDELKRYVSGAVAKRTLDLQHPTIDRDNVEMQLALPIAR